MGRAAKRPPHGVIARYQRGCRCRRCRRAWADYIRDRRRRLGQLPRAAAVAVRDAVTVRTKASRAAARHQDVVVPLRLSPLAAAILAQIQLSTGRRRGDVVDGLLRDAATAATPA